MADDFSLTTKRLLAARAGHLCSRPGCRCSTAGPGSTSSGSVNIGVAAHITAASPGGPRFDAALSVSKRQSAENGIWLCQSCAKLIDNDPSRFSTSLIRAWKGQAEELARNRLESPGAFTAPRQSRGLMICAFDVDGTLIRGTGFKYSWQLVWRFLGYDDDLRRRFFMDYESGRLSYDEWCETCAFYFRERGLRRADFAKIASGVTTTRRLHEALRMLRREGVATGVISGGIDSLLEEALPDYRILFDFVYINRFRYDHKGRFVGVTPTSYDFAGKIEALEVEAARRHGTLEHVVFVGEGRNDRFVMEELRRLGVGLTIAYPPNSTEIEISADRVIDEDDLTRVAEAVLTF